MAKKKEEEVVVEETTTTSKKKETKSKPSKEVKTPTPTKVEEDTVKTLLDWIDECEDSSFIFEKLIKHDYYQQYKTERQLRNQNKFIPPKVSRSEFKKIMEE